MTKSMENSEDDDEDDYFDEEDSHQGGGDYHKNEYRQRIDSEVRFKLQPSVQEIDKLVDMGAAKRNSLLFPAYSILKNSAHVQPSEFKALKHIEKVSHHNSSS